MPNVPLRFVPLCECLEDRRVLSAPTWAASFEDPGQHLQESASHRHETPPGQANGHNKHIEQSLNEGNNNNNQGKGNGLVNKPSSTPSAPEIVIIIIPPAQSASPPRSTPVTPVKDIAKPVVEKAASVVLDADPSLPALPLALREAEHNVSATTPGPDSEAAAREAAEVRPDTSEEVLNESAFDAAVAGWLQRDVVELDLTAEQVEIESAAPGQASVTLPVVVEPQFMQFPQSNTRSEGEAAALAVPFSANVDAVGRGIQQFLAQLDDMATGVNQSLAGNPYAAWCIMLGATLAGGELARRVWRRRRDRSMAVGHAGAEGFSWVPGLPNSISTEVL